MKVREGLLRHRVSAMRINGRGNEQRMRQNPRIPDAGARAPAFEPVVQDIITERLKPEAAHRGRGSVMVSRPMPRPVGSRKWNGD